MVLIVIVYVKHVILKVYVKVVIQDIILVQELVKKKKAFNV